MASSSSSSTKKSYMYDVFLSFRGEDTRKNFVDHLYIALRRHGIHTFKDDETLRKGKKIDDELLKAIEESKSYIVVFSKNYASSSWCLDELVKIMECQKTTEHIAYPVYYDVDPSEVRKQLGPVGEAFARHNNKGEVGKWTEALKEAARLAGWDLRNFADGYEAKVISSIVEKISLQLGFSYLKVNENLVGMESRIKDIVSSLELGVEDVRMIGIKGIGGGGKTTLARAVFDTICCSFEGGSFVENVRKFSKASLFGLRSLQEQVLSNVLGGSFPLTSDYNGKGVLKNMLCGTKVLIVLDDVDHLEQLEALAGGLNWFKPGSRIIITTRDEQVLIAHRVKLIHDVNLLSDDEAMCLFNRYAFCRDVPVQRYKVLSLKVVHYAAGLPLTIRVLGSFLYGKEELEWNDALTRLKTIPLKETLEKLELSYTSLEDDYKEIFLHVACLLKGWQKDDAIRALESCGFHARNGLRVLEQKSLITISQYQQLDMHDHLQEMARNIVRRSHPDEPIKHSLLWIQKEIEDVLADDLVTEATTAIATNIRSWHNEENLRSTILTKGFGNMKKLRFLHVVSNYYGHGSAKTDVGQNFPNGLRFLCWRGYSHWCLPTTFIANNLVALEMPHSRIRRLWEEGEEKVLKNLKFLDLSYSKLTTLDCGLLPNLETLNLEYCDHLAELHAPIRSLRRLVYLDLNHCNRLDFVSFIEQLESLQVLKNMIFVNFSYSDRTTVGLLPTLEDLEILNHEKHERLRKLVFLDLNHWRGFKSLSFIKQMKPLQVLNLGDLNLSEFPDILPSHFNYSLLELNFSRNNIEELPSSIGNLQKLVSLNLNWCKNLKSLPNSICMLKHLKTLLLAYCTALTELPEDLGLLQSLEELRLPFCKIIRDVPNSICKLKHLRKFDLSNCDQLRKLPEKLGDLEYLEELNVEGTGISHLPLSIYLLKGLNIIGSTSRDSTIYNATWTGANPHFYLPCMSDRRYYNLVPTSLPSKMQKQRDHKRCSPRSLIIVLLVLEF